MLDNEAVSVAGEQDSPKQPLDIVRNDEISQGTTNDRAVSVEGVEVAPASRPDQPLHDETQKLQDIPDQHNQLVTEAQDAARSEAIPTDQNIQHFPRAQPSQNLQTSEHDATPHVHPQAGSLSRIPNPPGTKAKRKRASPHQVALLNQIYEYTFFPSTELRIAIGKELSMAPRTVQIWFQNRRQAWRSQVIRKGQDDSTRSSDNERGGWEVLRSFQARRANGDIQEYEYMAIPSPQSVGPDGLPQNGISVVPYHPAMMQVASSSNDQFNSSMQQLPMPLPHTPRPIPTHTHGLLPDDQLETTTAMDPSLSAIKAENESKLVAE